MDCCSHIQSANKIFSFLARFYRKRFDSKGFEKNQQQLLEGLLQAGYQDAKILDIGSGVGALHHYLLQQGAAFATGIDLAQKMTEQARQRALHLGLDQRTQYFSGDFVALQEKLEKVDVTLLDKVICCYPDAHQLVQRSLDKTGKVYALTYPHKRWYVVLVMAFGSFLLWLMRMGFRNYVYDPMQVEQWIVSQGFHKTYENKTLLWLSQVYVRTN